MGKIKITIEDLFNVPTAVIYNPDAYKPLSSIVIDSRKVKKGCLFVAIEGEKFDGHDFVFDAIKKGARAVVVDKKKLKKFDSLEITLIAVYDTTKAYGNIARIWRNKLSAKVISITGSNGKTGVKEMIATLLEEKYGCKRIVKTEANNNNHIGVPLTILNADERCEALVLEQGTNHFKEIEYTAKISQPDFALITNIGDSHLEFLKNRESVYKEKSALFDEAEKRGGIIFLNMDDPIISKNKKNYKNTVTFGFKGKVDVKGKVLGYTDDGRTKIRINYKSSKNSKEKALSLGEGLGEAALPLYGESSAKNFLAASAVALKLGLNSKQIISGAQKFETVHGRLEVKKFKNALVIDDTYNASPTSVESAVELVKRIKTFKNKLIVLGDIYELGRSAPKLHKDLAELFLPDKNLIVLTIGNMMAHLHRALRKKKVKSIHFYLREALGLYLQCEEIENSVILVKGSRGMKMEEFVNILEKRFE